MNLWWNLFSVHVLGDHDGLSLHGSVLGLEAVLCLLLDGSLEVGLVGRRPQWTAAGWVLETRAAAVLHLGAPLVPLRFPPWTRIIGNPTACIVWHRGAPNV